MNLIEPRVVLDVFKVGVALHLAKVVKARFDGFLQRRQCLFAFILSRIDAGDVVQ